MIERRSPHQVGKEIARGINNGQIKFFDKHLSMFPVDLMYGFYTMNKPRTDGGKGSGKLDVVIVEASAITEDGGIIPGASVGASPELIQMADKVCLPPSDCFINADRLDHHRSQHRWTLLRRPTRYYND
jgi:acetyl-CoA hydrolase